MLSIYLVRGLVGGLLYQNNNKKKGKFLMASIKISDLSVDSESFLNELSESDLTTINGGILPWLILIGCALLLKGDSSDR
jgi:hypothetical protein